jgi:hypothetical protein
MEGIGSCPYQEAKMMTLEEFRKIEDIYPNAVEWILEGLGYAGDEEEISALMFAAALQKEASFQDGCVERKESHESYPSRLRRIACELARGAIAAMEAVPLPHAP